MFDPEDLAMVSTTKAEQLSEILRCRIHGGDLTTGTRLLSERALASAARVSRATVRNAVSQLLAAGYLEVRRGPQGGAFVCDLSVPSRHRLLWLRDHVEEYEDLVDIRMGLESRIVRLAARRRDAADLSAMREALGVFAPDRWRETYALSDMLFHAALGRASRNPSLERAYLVARARAWTPAVPHLRKQTMVAAHNLHRLIHRAIVDQDESSAVRCTEEHLDRARACIALAMARMEPEPGKGGGTRRTMEDTSICMV